MKPLSLLSAGLVTGVIALFALLGPVSERGLAVRPVEAVQGVTVSVNCRSNPETTRVANNSGHAITIRAVGSIYQPRSNEPFAIGYRLRPGRAITFESGYDANSNTLTRQYIYNNDVGTKEGTRVSTSDGRLIDRC